MHPTVEPLGKLVGTWRGNGVASYPTMTDFPYTEELVVLDVDKPFLPYTQRTWSVEGRPAHMESGYLRVTGDGNVEIVVAIPTGQSECGAGEFSTDEAGLYVSTDATVQCTPAAKTVDRIVRSYHCTDDKVVYDMAMAAVGLGLTAHLHGELDRA